MQRIEREHRHRSAVAALALLSDADLIDLLATGLGRASSIGGSSASLDIEGTPVFAKCVPVTDLELAAQNRGSTANLFDLPNMYHYGVGSAGTNVWRELAAHTIVTRWALTKQAVGFPMLHHSRLLPFRTAIAADEGRADIESVIAYWDGSSAVGRRVEALAASTNTLVLFLEYIPLTLGRWLSEQSEAGKLESACQLAERQLLRTVEFMSRGGLHHFDVHLNNVLVDGQRLYVTDFGLASSCTFDLTLVERDFLAANTTHDRCLARTVLVNWIVSHLMSPRDAAHRNEIVRGLAAGDQPGELTSSVGALVRRHAAVAVVINDFYWKLFGESRAAPYPAALAEDILSSHGHDDFNRRQ